MPSSSPHDRLIPYLCIGRPNVAGCVVLVFLLISIAVVTGQEPQAGKFTPDQVAFFESKIRPLLLEKCADCHSGETPESNFRVDSRADLLTGGKLGPAIQPGKPKSSLLISAVHHSEFVRMPPKEKLRTQQILDLTRWVEMGAPWPSDSGVLPPLEEAPLDDDDSASITEEDRNYWAFQPPRESTLPNVANVRWPRNAIDYFVLAKLEAEGVSPAPPADRRTLIRRVTFDLTGLPPRFEEVEAFARDDSPGAYKRLLDRLLASPAY